MCVIYCQFVRALVVVVAFRSVITRYSLLQYHLKFEFANNCIQISHFEHTQNSMCVACVRSGYESVQKNSKSKLCAQLMESSNFKVMLVVVSA